MHSWSLIKRAVTMVRTESSRALRVQKRYLLKSLPLRQVMDPTMPLNRFLGPSKSRKPSKAVFFEERKQDARYDDVKTAALSRIAAKRGISGEKALALFNSDNYDSDGDGVSNLIERAFGGDSLEMMQERADPLQLKPMMGKNTSPLLGTHPTSSLIWVLPILLKKFRP